MLATILSLAVVLSTTAPTPFPRPLPEFQPGTYPGKWSGGEWGHFRFDPDGRFYARYQTQSYEPCGGWWAGMCDTPKYYDCEYQGLWSWDPKKRILTIREKWGKYTGDPKEILTQHLLRFGKNFERADINIGGELLLRPREK